eukprot:gene26186-31620_t
MVLLLCLPDPVLSEFLSEWIKLDTVYSLDMAYTNKRHRKHLLTILGAINKLHISSIMPHRDSNANYFRLVSRQYGFNYIQWVASRQVKARFAIEMDLGYSGTINFLYYLCFRSLVLPYVSNLSIRLRRSMSKDVVENLKSTLGAVFTVFPNALLHLIVDFTPICCRKLLSVQSMLLENPNLAEITILYVPDPVLQHNYHSWLNFRPEIPDEIHHPERAAFFRVFGAKVVDVRTEVEPQIVRLAGIHLDAVVCYIMEHCPNLKAIPFLLNLDLADIRILSRFPPAKLVEAAFYINRLHLYRILFAAVCGDGDQPLLTQTIRRLERVSDCTLQFSWRVGDETIAPASAEESYFRLLVAFFKHCPHLVSFSSKMLTWNKDGEHNAALGLFLPSYVSVHQWASFLADLAESLPVVTKVELHLSARSSPDFLEAQDPYVMAVLHVLQTARCFSTLQHVCFSGILARMRQVSGCFLSSVYQVTVLFKLNAELVSLPLLATCPLLLCFANAKTLRVTCLTSPSRNGELNDVGAAIMGVLDVLPCVDELIVFAYRHDMYLTTEFVQFLANSGRTWKTLDFGSQGSRAVVPDVLSLVVSAIKQGSLVVKKLVLRGPQEVVYSSLGHGRMPIVL